jgi:hypothetical protein
MSTPTGSSSIQTIWQQQRQAVMYMGQALHDQLPEGDPPVSIHGRELDQASEGTGFQFQLTINGYLYDGRFRAAYFVVQVQIIKRKAGLGWLVDAMPILEIEHGNYDLYSKQTREFAYRDRTGLEHFMLDILAGQAATFFENVRTGTPPDEKATVFGGGRTEPVL